MNLSTARSFNRGKEIGIRTIFNILGPLCNPALADYQLLGVYSRELTPVLARVLKRLGIKRAFVVHGKDLADEVFSNDTKSPSSVNSRGFTNA